MPTPWDQKKKAEMARMLAEAEAEAISSDARDEDFTFGGPEGGWEAFKAGFGKEATYGFGDEAAAALSGVETTDEERIASNEEMDAVINKNAINAALGFVGGVAPSIAGLAYGTLTKAAAKAAALAATKAAGPAAGLAASKLAAKEVIKKITPLKAIGINAAEGAVSGAGEGEGVEGRIKGAGIGGTIGALVGSGAQAIPGVTRAVADTISNDRKIQNAASEMAKEDAERLARELAFQESVKVSKFKVAPPNPHLGRDIADIETDLKAINSLRAQTQRSGGNKDALKALDIQRKSLLEAQAIKRPEIATARETAAAKETAKDDVFTEKGNTAYMTDEQIEAAADAREAAIAKKKKKGGGGEGEGGAGGGDSGGGGPRDDGGGSGLSSALKATEDKTIDPETGLPVTDELIKRKEITRETTKTPAIRRILREGEVENDDIEFKSLKTPRPDGGARLDFSDINVDEDGNFIYGNTFGFNNRPRRPTADELPTDEEIKSANEAAALTRAMKAKNIPLNEARLQIPSRQLNPQAMMAAPQSPAATPQWSYPTPEGERGKIVINDNSPPATKKQPVIKRPYLTEGELEAMDRFNPVFEEARIKAEEEDLDVSYKTALDMFVPTTKAEKADSVVLVELGYAPIQRPRLTVEAPKMFETSPGGTVRDVSDSDFYSISSQIGQGAYGRVHEAVNQQGKRKIIKVSAPADNEPDTLFDLRHERDVVEEMMKIRPTLPKEVAQHFVNTEKILTNPADPDNGFVLVMQELRPMNPRERLALYRGRSVEERAVGVPDSYIGEDFDFPTSSYNRRPLTVEDYKNMPYNVRKFYKALEYLADEKGIEWRDLHEGNVMVDPKTGEYVALDIGQFKLYGRTASGDPGTANLPKETPGGTHVGTNTLARTRMAAVEAAKKERNKALSPAEIARQFKQPNRSAGAMAAEPGFNEDEAGQLLAFSPQTMASKDVSNPTEAAIERYMSDFADAGIPEPNRIPTAENYERWFASVQRRLVTMTDKAFKMPRGPEKDNLKSQISDMTTGLEQLRDQLRWRSTENAEQMSFDFPETGGKNIAEQLARRETKSSSSFPSKRAPSSRSRNIFSGKPKKQKELPSAGSTTGGTAMIPVGSRDIIKRAKGPGIIERAGKALRGATDKLNLGELRSERDILESEYDFYNYKLHKATTEREIRAAERELALASYDLDVHKGRYPDMQDFEAEIKEINDAQASGIYVNRRKGELINKMIETFRKYPQMMDPKLAKDHPIKVAWDTW